MNSPYAAIKVMTFRVSVITPVYNAAKYIRNAVESAVHLQEVHEVILVEDASPDNALQICHQLEKEYAKVKLFRHPNGENRGAGASRNLGIEKATGEYIAFLDADDWYLPNRFVKDKLLFESDNSIDGVYGCTQSVLDLNEKLEFLQEYSTVNGIYDQTTLQLGWLTGTIGAFTTDAITVRKSFMDKVGNFDTTLRLHQDSHLYYRFLWHGKIVPGEIVRPIAVRRKHNENRIAQKNEESRNSYYRKLFQSYELVKNPDRRIYIKLFNRYVSTYGKGRFMAYVIRIWMLSVRPSRILKLI